MKKKNILKNAFSSCVILSLLLGSGYSELTSVKADEKMVDYLLYSFDNKLDGWSITGAPRGALDKENKYKGDTSIKITNRKDNSYSIGLDAHDVFYSGKKYKFSIAFYQYSETDQIMTLAGRTANGKEYDIVSGSIPPNQWVELTGEAMIYEEDPINYLFVSTVDGTIDFNVDEITIYRDSEAPVLKVLDGSNPNQQAQQPVQTQQNQPVQTAAVKEEKVSETADTNIQIIDNEEDSSDSWLIIIIIIGAVLAAFCIIFSVLLLSKKKKNTSQGISSKIDPVTKFPNKTEYEDTVLHYIHNPDECTNSYVLICSVCFIKYINDNFGMDTGDKAIVRCADCLRNTIGKEAKIFRTAGNEFMCFSEKSMIDTVSKAINEEKNKNKEYPFECALGEASCKEMLEQNSNSDIRNTIMKADEIMGRQKEKITSEAHLERLFPGK